MTATATKERSTQALEAIADANRIRIAQKEMLRLLSRSELALDQVFEIEEAKNMSLFRVLEALPYRNTLPTDRRPRRCSHTAEQILIRSGVAGDRPMRSFHCDITKGEILSAAYDIVGRTAWIYLEDVPPRLKPPKVPQTSAAQLANCAAAAKKGNQIRIRRKEMKAALRSGEMTFKDVLEDPASSTWQIGRLVENLPLIDRATGEPRGRTAPDKALRALKKAGIALTHPVNRLLPSEIESIVALMETTMLTEPSYKTVAK